MATKAGRFRSRSPWNRMTASEDAVRSATDQHQATIACPRGVGCLYPCGGSRRISSMPHGEWSAPSMEWLVEHIPWSDGKRPVTCAMMGFLARWARRLSWRETAQVFRTSWEAVYRSVEWFVEWGLAHRKLRGVESIGVDEIHWGHGLRADNFLTVIYQIDAHC